MAQLKLAELCLPARWREVCTPGPLQHMAAHIQISLTESLGASESADDALRPHPVFACTGSFATQQGARLEGCTSLHFIRNDQVQAVGWCSPSSGTSVDRLEGSARCVAYCPPARLLTSPLDTTGRSASAPAGPSSCDCSRVFLPWYLLTRQCPRPALLCMARP